MIAVIDNYDSFTWNLVQYFSELGAEVEVFRKHCLLNGLDEIGLTLRQADKIRVFEAKRIAQFPWLFR